MAQTLDAFMLRENAKLFSKHSERNLTPDDRAILQTLADANTRALADGPGVAAAPEITAASPGRRSW